MKQKLEKIKNFDPNGLGASNSNIFGLPFTTEEAEIIIIPLPWEVTVSYSAGTADGPAAIFEASKQVDLYDPDIKDAWQLGISMEKINKEWAKESEKLRKKAEKYIEMLAEGENHASSEKMAVILKEVNTASSAFNKSVKQQCLHYLNRNKLVVGLGGDHSTPLGLIDALAEKHRSFAVLQIDAHADLRKAYEGFEYSHASIMYNVLKIKNVSKLVQVGIRDYCQEEADRIKGSKGRVKTFFDRDIKRAIYKGKSVAGVHKEIVAQLPQKVYLSFDIDGLDPKLCPNTGTPVAGGFEFEEVLFLIQNIVDSGKTIIGFDLNEVAPGKDEWNANVGARLLYRICNMMAQSNGLFKSK
jgi:agmatinase